MPAVPAPMSIGGDSPSAGSPAMTHSKSAPSQASQPCKLFVGGLSAQTTTEALRTHFQKYGRLVDAVVMCKQGRPRGFGFVTFDSPLGASATLAEPQWLDGRFVDVKRAVPGELTPDTPERPTNKIFVGGLPTNAGSEDLRACFVDYGCISDAVVMFDRRTKRSRGFGFVRFNSGPTGAAAADAVIRDALKHKIGGKWIEVKRATPAALLRESSPSNASDGIGLAKAVSQSSLPTKQMPVDWRSAVKNIEDKRLVDAFMAGWMGACAEKSEHDGGEQTDANAHRHGLARFLPPPPGLGLPPPPDMTATSPDMARAERNLPGVVPSMEFFPRTYADPAHLPEPAVWPELIPLIFQNLLFGQRMQDWRPPVCE